MKFTIRVKPNARAAKVEQLEDGSYKVSVTAVADKGQANSAVVETLAEYFQVPKSTIVILSGQTSRIKVVSIQQ